MHAPVPLHLLLPFACHRYLSSSLPYLTGGFPVKQMSSLISSAFLRNSRTRSGALFFFGLMMLMSVMYLSIPST